MLIFQLYHLNFRPELLVINYHKGLQFIPFNNFRNNILLLSVAFLEITHLIF